MYVVTKNSSLLSPPSQFPQKLYLFWSERDANDVINMKMGEHMCCYQMSQENGRKMLQFGYYSLQNNYVQSLGA